MIGLLAIDRQLNRQAMEPISTLTELIFSPIRWVSLLRKDRVNLDRINGVSLIRILSQNPYLYRVGQFAPNKVGQFDRNFQFIKEILD